MTTATTKVTKPAIINEELKSSLILMDMLKAIGKCKITKEANDSEIHPLLTKALGDVYKQRVDVRDYTMEVFLRNLFFTFSIQRQHNLWKTESIKSDELGGQMRSTGRSIVRWLANNMSEWLYSRDSNGYLYNLNLIVEYANYDLLVHNEIKTRTSTGKTGSLGSKKTPNKIVSHETMNIPVATVVEMLVQNYRANKSKSLIARWMPKHTSINSRTTTIVAGKDLKKKVFDATGKAWVKINDVKHVVSKTNYKFDIKDGDVITYPRLMQAKTLERIAMDNQIILLFNKEMGWDVKKYKEFRHEYMMLTPEHQFSSGAISQMKKDQFETWLGNLSAGQQWVVSRTLCYKGEKGELLPKPTGKFVETKLPEWYLDFVKKDEKKADEVRVAISTGDFSKARAVASTVKAKTTGIQTIDLIADLASGRKTATEIDTLYTTLTAKFQMDVPVYVILDGSGSMTSLFPYGDARLSYLDVALTLGITFMVTNPIEEYRSSCMWFGAEAVFTGVTKYANSAPNRFLVGNNYVTYTGPKKVVDPSKKFSENFKSLKGANPGMYARTNAGQVVTTFMQLVKEGKMIVEELPRVLLFITDEEYNTGLRPVEGNGKGFTQIPNEIGWNPLFVFWGIKTTTRLDDLKDAPNCMVTRGFQENNLTEILRFIKKGSINMYDELFAIAEMPGLAPVKFPFVK